MNRSPAIVFVTFVAACNAVLGLEERPERDAASAGGGTIPPGTGGGDPCEAACESDVPTGWSGPTAVQIGSAPATCDDAARPNVELSLFGDVVPAPAECACACEDATGIQCNASVVALTTYDNENCTEPRDAGSGFLNDCVRLCCGGQSANYVAPTPDVSAASCAPTTLATNVPPPVWGSHVIGCGPLETEPCGGQACFEEVDGSETCIHRSGEHACPDGPFSEGRVWYADFDDGRGCEPCGCGDVNAACNEVVTGYAVDNCTVGDALLAAAPACTVAPLDFDGARIQSVNPTGSCMPTGGAASGEVTPTQPTTVCCLP